MPLDAMALKVREYGRTGMLFASVKLWSRKPDARKIIGRIGRVVRFLSQGKFCRLQSEPI